MILQKKMVAILATALIGIGAACSGDDGTTDAAEATATEAAATEAVAATEVTTIEATEAATEEAATAEADEGPGGGGPGGGVSVDAVATVDELIALVEQAYGDGGLGLHRGHQDVQDTLTATLDGITHDELHVRMESQGQNLAAIATDLGTDPQALIDALVAADSPAIDNLLAAGTMTQDQADAYLVALQDAYTFRVNWNGEDATPSFSGV